MTQPLTQYETLVAKAIEMLEPLGSVVAVHAFGPADPVGVATEFDVIRGDFKLSLLVMPDVAHLYIDSDGDSARPHLFEYRIAAEAQDFERELHMLLTHGYTRRSWRDKTLGVEVTDGKAGFKSRNHLFNLLPRQFVAYEKVDGILK